MTLTEIRLPFLPVVRLDQDHLVAAVVLQHADQPIVEATDFQDGHERFGLSQTLVTPETP